MKVYLRVGEGVLEPADETARRALREAKLTRGMICIADIKKPRNPAFNRLVHAIGKLVVENLDSFAGLDSHTAIKRLQLEGRIAVKESMITLGDGRQVLYTEPESLSFDKMDEIEFHDLAMNICRFIADKYWPDCTDTQVLAMAEKMIQE